MRARSICAFLKQVGVAVALCIIALSFTFQDSVSSERPVLQIDYHAPAKESSRRVYFFEPSGDEAALLALREQLIEAGAYHVNTFTPSHIVCMLPKRLSASSFSPSAVAVEATDLEASGGASAVPEVDFYRACYQLAEELAATKAAPFAQMHDGVDERYIKSTPLMATPEEMAAADRSAEPIHLSSGGTTAYRRWYQNTEFMLGDIVVNLVLPESAYYWNTENWSNDEMTAAIKGSIAALLTFQDNYPHAAMNFIIRSYKKVPTYYECIRVTIDGHESWVRRVIGAIDSRFYSYWDPAAVVVHRFNTAALNYYQADWVFTMFIVAAENAMYHMFAESRQVAFAQFGGPYLACPFPAGNFYFHGDESFRLAAYLQREIGHVFWALDEDLNNKGDCHNRSGYLNYENGNKVDDIIMGVPVNECDVPGICVMENPSWGAGVVCSYTAAHMGIIDSDENSVPDIFDSSPVINFQGGYAETLVVDTFTVRGTVRSIPIPNHNIKQDSTKWNSYACALKDAVMNINGYGNLYLLPEDKRWDSTKEDIVIPLTDLKVGLTTVEIQVRNTAGFKSLPITKNIFRAGLTYSLYSITVGDEAFNLSWYMVGETFNAQFDLYRITENSGVADTTLIATGLQPSGEPENQFLPYAYCDTDIEPTKTYRYFVRGTYQLSIQGGEPQTFITDSKIFKATANIPIPDGDIISTIYPNPFTTATNFSLKIPHSYANSGVEPDPASPAGDNGPRGISYEVPTEVKIIVYDVQGRYVATVLDDAFYGSVLTMQWDGTTDTNEPVPSGVYFMKSIIGNRIDVKKITILR